MGDLYNSAKSQASLQRRIVCRGCSKKPDSPKCSGCGRCPDEIRMVQRQMGPGMIIQQEERVASKEKCKTEDTALKTTIERGMSDGSTVRFPRMSEQTPGQVPGDVIMTIKQKRHST